MSEIISSGANPVIKQVRALEDKKERAATGQFFLAGQRDICAALAAGWQADSLLGTPELRLSDDERAIIAACPARQITITADLAGRISGRDNAQNLLAVMRQRWAAPAQLAHGLWVGLEDVRDPGNLGTIMRTAVAAGAAGLILIGECCDPYAGEVIRASVGTFAHCPMVKMSREEFASWRASYSGQVVATHLAAKTDYRKANYDQPAILLMGSESHGLTEGTAALASINVLIPMTAKAESLNVAAATALMLYEMQRTRL